MAHRFLSSRLISSSLVNSFRFASTTTKTTNPSSMASLFGLTAVETVDLVPGHLKKEVITAVASGATPSKGQTVSAHYTGKLPNGTDFDSSRKRGRPFQFKIGVGQVIQGWDVGMASMKKGERAVFTISYQYAYGNDGYPPIIPPKSTLVFDVEILDFQ